jgi:hypothetical protein
MDPHRQLATHAGRRPMHRAAAVLAVLALGLGACSTADDEPDEATSETDASLPAGWESEAVPDQQTGPFTLGVPEDAVVWSVGSPLQPLEELTSGSEWWAFWEPRLASVEPETSNVRAMVAIPDEGEVRSLQVNVNPYDLDVEADDAQGIADALALVAEAQGNEVTATRTRPYEGPEVDEVGEIAFSVDPALLERDVRQRFYPVPSQNALWSVQCDGPSGADLEVVCDDALDAFRPPVVDGD